ncbi:unnamed protein product, partial [Vitis vinifera]
MLLKSQDLLLGSSQWTSAPDMNQYGLPTYRHFYDLNSPPESMAEAVSGSAISHFAPITPDKNRRKQEKAIDTTRVEVNHLHYHIIDLNKTPQQKPRRKKHRPKVVIEGKPKRTPKPVNPKCTGSQGNPTGKRKYVRKNGVNKPSTNSPAEIMGRSTEPERPERTMMSCRRGLNFDDNGRARGGSSSCISTSDLNSEPQAQDFCTQGIQSKSVVMLSKEMEVTVEETQVGIAYDLTRSMNQELKNYVSLPDRQFPSTPPQRNTDHPWEKLKNDAQNENDRERASQEIVCDKQENILQESLKSMSPNNTNCSTSASLKEREHRRGTKRVHSHIVDKADPRTMSMNGNQYNSVQAYHAKFQANEQNRNPGMHFPEIYKKKRTEKGLNSTATNLSPVMAAKNIVMLATACPQNHAIPKNGGQDKVQTFDCMLALGPRERLTKKRSKGLTRVRDLASLNGIALCKLLPNFPDKRISPNPDVQGAESSNRPHTCIEALVAETSKLARRKRTKKRNPVVGSTSSRTNEVQLHQQTDVYNNRQLLKLADPPELIWKHMLSIDTIIEQLKHLDINRESKISYQEQNALVPYNMNKEEKNALVLYKRDGTIVPFEDSFGLVKKRRPRPRVDLDEETSRVWKLLMGNINSEGIDGTDEEKAKWWEEERNVFRGRADSFIARMHLVQGDRRFSKWKGSVVDSVVGVFLTQNVSDHLSSSAFMSLAAHFPCKCNHRPSTELETRILVEEPEVCTLNPEDTVTWNEKMSNQAVCDQNFSIAQTAEKIGSCSESNSEVEDIMPTGYGLNNFDGSTSFVGLLQMAESTRLHEVFCRSNINATCGANPKDFTGSNHYPFHGLTAESDNQAKDEKKLTESIQAGPTSSCENTFSDNNLQGENNKIIDETGVKEHGLSSSKASNEIGVDTSKAKKGKARREEKNTLHWDNLRKEAQVNGRKRERTVNTMDSLDWEAVRCSDVNEIANTIKERGMNNMLAERIKDFLNRLVRDHGSIDLEWLRDVPPDKAKEYLLSFRGLGLKSVECVRLLTLHHLAFPVDTNVGRIAVRLGWVPLQPLPESLQLHLLELYPVLESIQKYLWPRLCKLDQRTLYELHYQMITFGKVFCTKSKPNCNACPMRGECRHFASAFASARLALTGPEERSIVSTNANESMDGNPDVTINPLPLPPPLPQKQSSEANPGINNCEPIVEVPATPEQEHPQILESDIEDTLYEDPDEIPTIKLNIEEFTHNLQNYMQRNMELQESDMSKALVALTPEVASIPMPKLKNVSRLRTEHHVYELPDSHPLLEGLDKREPDDPCSYLLAIWTPGETANSIQPPERTCSSQESGGLCDEKTCFSCNSIREANSQTVRGTLLIPCRTAMRGSFPLNGTYFQVNEVFADHDSSLNPIDVPRAWIWNLPRRTVYFGTSIPTIFKGLSTEDIQYCFWRGFVCVRGFDQKTRAPRPLMARLHFPASRLTRTKGKINEN